jgi:putative DNA primase/helicase
MGGWDEEPEEDERYAQRVKVREREKTEPPRVPRLLYSDVTPEALAWSLARGCPSGGVVSAEAETVFGSHGMGTDSVMRNLSMLNQLWDGSSLAVDRRTSESLRNKNETISQCISTAGKTARRPTSQVSAFLFVAGLA